MCPFVHGALAKLFNCLRFYVMSSKESDDIIAYVHNLSPLRRNKKNTVDYSTLQLQVNGIGDEIDFQEALCFSKTKRKLLMDKQESRTPVKITRYTRSTDKKKIIINDVTHVAKAEDIEYSFQFRSNENETLSSVQKIKNQEVSEYINILGKIVKIDATKEVNKGHNNWKVANAVLADHTGKIDIEFWNDYIGSVEVGETYIFRNMRTRCWNDLLKLTTSFSTTVSKTCEPPSFDELRHDEDDNDEEGQTVQVSSIEAVESVKKYKTCVRCARRILQPNQRVVSCDNCGYSARSDRCKTTIHAVVVISTGEGKTQHLTIFEDLLREVIGESEIETEKMDTESVIEKLVFLEKMNITFNERNVVTSISFYE